MNKSILNIKPPGKAIIFVSGIALSITLSGKVLSANQDLQEQQETNTQEQAPEKPLPKNAYKADQLLGKSVKNRKDENVGEIKELVIDESGQIKYAVLSHGGGLLNLGTKMTAVSWKVLQPSPEEDHYILNMDITKEQLSDAPTFNEDNWPTEAQVTEFSAFESKKIEKPEAQ
ncbi:PRC-barrel domain-containing protein [Nitrosococcus wardiae]|uniref:PRC-barrel domain containing protein n=1 Tax=Nitrosococcus wardiae TaxID=1814290 RepID=A0A4P7C203_9GAMM|nr:PRC-barrel domain-containing protein [Nitrosococcus wardiae]QBQ55687.1 PRC-barrel domain containing protein [Nitrosococcus wardiae]